jgi:hypothetical protein
LTAHVAARPATGIPSTKQILLKLKEIQRRIALHHLGPRCPLPGPPAQPPHKKPPALQKSGGFIKQAFSPIASLPQLGRAGILAFKRMDGRLDIG